MSKALRHYWLIIAMGLLGLILTVSNILLWVIFIRGFFASRQMWLDIHKWVGLALMLPVPAHVRWHWAWIKRMTGRYLARVSSGQPGKRQ